MQEIATISLLLAVMILILAVFGSFVYNFHENNKNRGIIQAIFKEPKNMKKLGEGIYYGFSQSIKGTKGNYNKKAIAFRRGIIDSVVPPEIVNALPEQLRESVRNEPLLITEALKVIAAFKTGGLQGVIQSILKQLGSQMQENPLLKAVGISQEEETAPTGLSEEHANLIKMYEEKKAETQEVEENGN